MCSHGRAVRSLLQRCVAVRQAALSTRIETSGVPSGWCGSVRQRAWTSAAWSPVLRGLCPRLTAAKSTQYSFCSKPGEPCQDEYPPLMAYQPPPEPDKKEIYIVQVKGLPWTCTAADLLHFFSDCRICDGENGIHLTLNSRGRPTGEAFIVLEHEDDISKAMDKHRQYLGPRYIEVLEVSNSDAEAILQKAIQTPINDGVVRLRGIPFNCTKDDIIHFFSGLPIIENGVTVVTDHTGRNCGEAFVQFSSPEAALEALQRHREVIGNRYIEVFLSRCDEIYSVRRKRGSDLPHDSHLSENRTLAPQTSRTIRPSQGLANTPYYVHMRGLPFQASGEDIVGFFFPLAVSKILIECGPDGRRNGQADVYFRSHQDAMAAMSKDRHYIGRRYIELYLNSVPESEGC